MRISPLCFVTPDGLRLVSASDDKRGSARSRRISWTSYSNPVISGWHGRSLLLLANFGKEGKPETAISKISPEALSELFGTTRSRIGFFMNKFRRLGFINYSGHLEVYSSLLNVVLHNRSIDKREYLT